MLFKKKKIVYLDIDGVFNALSSLDINNRTLITHPWGTWQIANENIEFLKYLNKTCKCIWISTWYDESNEINKFLNIPAFKYVEFKQKSDIIDQILNKKLKSGAIIDDEIYDERVFSIKIDEKSGLNDQNRQEIVNWINQ